MKWIRSTKYDIRICKCGRIHTIPYEKIDKALNDNKNIMKKIKENLFNRFACILYAIAAVLSAIYGLVYGPFYVHFIDGLTIMGALYFMIAVILWGQKGKIIDMNSIRLKRFSQHSQDAFNENEHYGYYKEKNKFIYPSLLVLLIAFILASLY